MGCGCGGQKKELNKPNLQKPVQPPARPPAPQQFTPNSAAPPSQVHGAQVAQLQVPTPPATINVSVGPAPAAPEPDKNVKPAPQLSPPPPPPRPALSSNADAVREALKRRREQMAASRMGSKPRQY